VPLLLRQVAPGRYQQQVRVADPGAYRVSLNQSRADEPAQTITTGFVAPYPAEYALPPEGAGEPLLRHIAGTTGGQVVANADSFLAATLAASSQNKTTQPLTLWPWLLLGALLLWPLEIAWRRWGRLRIH
jgi:Ca-activated chloride channel homolog